MTEFIETVKENISSFIEENSKMTASIIAIFVVLFISATFALVVHTNGTPRSRARSLPEQTFNAPEEFLPPARMPLTEDYYFSRISPDSWSDEDRERWFTEPSDATVQELGEANNALVNTILEAAP